MTSRGLSLRYKQLQRSLGDLRAQLLPRQFSPTGAYAPRIIARARAYRLLSHAEFETYFEDRATELANAAVNAWRASRLPSRAMIALVAYARTDKKSVPEGLLPDRREDLTERINEATAKFLKSIEANHGVTESNLAKLLFPVGVLDTDLDPVWVTDMSSFGERRGAAAHQTAHGVAVQHPVDPKTEYQCVQKLLLGAAPVDRVLSGLLA